MSVIVVMLRMLDQAAGRVPASTASISNPIEASAVPFQGDLRVLLCMQVMSRLHVKARAQQCMARSNGTSPYTTLRHHSRPTRSRKTCNLRI